MQEAEFKARHLTLDVSKHFFFMDVYCMSADLQ